MIGFTEISRGKTDSKDFLKIIDNYCLYSEYCTLRIDGGRQTGKTRAMVEFAAEWLREGNSVVYVTRNFKGSMDFNIRIKRYTDLNYSFCIDTDNLICCSRRDLLSDGCNAFRGRTLKNVLLIIDENVDVNIDKFYEAYNDKILLSTKKNEENKPPLFFVIGRQ